MTSILDRAMFAYPMFKTEDANNVQTARSAYIKGATDQKQIDIEKACEVYRKELSEIISIFNRIGKELYDINELGELISLEGSITDFRKAMEG